jgi:hypothetical protein
MHWADTASQILGLQIHAFQVANKFAAPSGSRNKDDGWEDARKRCDRCDTRCTPFQPNAKFVNNYCWSNRSHVKKNVLSNYKNRWRIVYIDICRVPGIFEPIVPSRLCVALYHRTWKKGGEGKIGSGRSGE